MNDSDPVIKFAFFSLTEPDPKGEGGDANEVVAEDGVDDSGIKSWCFASSSPA